MCTRLNACGYAPWLLDRAKSKVDNIPRETFLREEMDSQSSKGEQKSVFFSTPYSVEFKYISGIIHKYLLVPDSDPVLSEILKEGCKIVARKAPTVANILAPSWVQTVRPKTQTWLIYRGCFKCGHGTCICCSVMNVSNNFVSAVTQQTYKMKQYSNCNTSYVVYLMTCAICIEQYVGSTKCPLKVHIRRHLSDVKSPVYHYTVYRNITEYTVYQCARY